MLARSFVHFAMESDISTEKRKGCLTGFSFPTGFCSRLHKGGHYFVQINHFFIHGLCSQVFFTESPGFIFPHNFTVLLIADNFQNDGTCFVTGQIGRRQFERCLCICPPQGGSPIPVPLFRHITSGTYSNWSWTDILLFVSFLPVPPGSLSGSDN